LRWAYIIDESKVTHISGNNCHFLESEITEVNTKTKEQEISGVDGVLVGANTFDAFELTLKFYYNGVDNSDLILFTEKIKRIIHTRNPMYVVHSEMARRKYAFNSAKIEWEKITNSDVTFSIVFNCFKGYSESLYPTDQFSLGDGKWQFESGLVPDSNIKYKHTRTLFDIFNGSSDTIDPRHGHKLKIRVRLATETGFKIINKKTGDVFEYKGSLKANQSFVIDGGYAYKDEKRCGRQTNHGIITLAPGYNTFEVWGKISDFEIEFIFPFIYR